MYLVITAGVGRKNGREEEYLFFTNTADRSGVRPEI